MKKLYLVRHAKATSDDGSTPDIDRELNKRGKRDASFMGKLMKDKKVSPTLFISSPAARALTTAELFAEKIAYRKDEILIDPVLYSFNTDLILSFITGTKDEVDSLMLFSHNPSLTDVFNFLVNSQEFSLPTCAIAAVQFNMDKWSEIADGKGKLLFLEYPKLHTDAIEKHEG
jgi:phosphohistidine phosphatase